MFNVSHIVNDKINVESKTEYQTIFNGDIEVEENKEILNESNIPEGTQSIGVFIRKSGATDSVLSVRQSISTTSGSDRLSIETYNDSTREQLVTIPVLGTKLRLHLENKGSVSRGFYVWLAFFKQPQTPTHKKIFSGGLSDGFSREKIITTSPTRLDNIPCETITVQAKSNNAATVYLGFEDGQYIELNPSDSMAISVNNSNLLYIRGNSGDGVNYMGVST